VSAELAEKHVEHVHSGGCHRRLDYGPAQSGGDMDDAVLVNQEGPAGYCDAGGCHQDWPCDTRLALDERDAAIRRASDVTPEQREAVARVLEHIEPWASGPVIAKHVGMVAAALRSQESQKPPETVFVPVGQERAYDTGQRNSWDSQPASEPPEGPPTVSEGADPACAACGSYPHVVGCPAASEPPETEDRP
jgi:hypothetical protein